MKIKKYNIVFKLFFLYRGQSEKSQPSSQHLISGSGSWQGFILVATSSDWQPHNSRQDELCLSRPGEREPEPPHRAANLTNGEFGPYSHHPELLQESPEKWHHRGDTLPGTGWRDALKRWEKESEEGRNWGVVVEGEEGPSYMVLEQFEGECNKGQLCEEQWEACSINCLSLRWNFNLTSFYYPVTVVSCGKSKIS